MVRCLYDIVDIVLWYAIQSDEIPKGMKRYRDSTLENREPTDKTEAHSDKAMMDIWKRCSDTD
jgi:hypothetical protein